MIKEILQGRALNHPLHPMLVHLPIGLWVGSFIFDIIYLASGNFSFSVASYYCMLIGLISVLLAAPTGLAELIQIPRGSQARRLGTLHMTLNVSVSILYLLNVIFRHNLGTDAVTWGEFLLSLVSLAILGASGYVGGLLVYDHGIGFKPQTRDVKVSESERRPPQAPRAA